MRRLMSLIVASAALAAATTVISGQQQEPEGFRFRSAVELVNVTATVTDASGRFVSGLGQHDFVVHEDGERQDVTHFSNERVPVSLGIVVDTSGSMAGERIEAARSALDRFLFDLLGPEDEIFLARFSEYPELLESWTTDRRRLSRAVSRLGARGGTALYDAVAEAVPMAQSGQHRKKAVVVISDGNDTSSRISVSEVQRLVRETEVLVYAIGIDGAGEPTLTRRNPGGWPGPGGLPFPIPGRRPPVQWPQPPSGGGGGTWTRGGNDGVDVATLRALSDPSGGRTEIIRRARDLDPSTASIADELSKQYYLGYSSTRPRDGRWHRIDVEVPRGNYHVRARSGYIASP
jgi:Ca-activated chloride channel homolog